jgi:hypothetical protein
MAQAPFGDARPRTGGAEREVAELADRVGQPGRLGLLGRPLQRGRAAAAQRGVGERPVAEDRHLPLRVGLGVAPRLDDRARGQVDPVGRGRRQLVGDGLVERPLDRVGALLGLGELLARLQGLVERLGVHRTGLLLGLAVGREGGDRRGADAQGAEHRAAAAGGGSHAAGHSGRLGGEQENGLHGFSS